MSLTLMLTYPFMQRALIAGTLVSLCAALLGVPLVLKRYSMIGRWPQPRLLRRPGHRRGPGVHSPLLLHPRGDPRGVLPAAAGHQSPLEQRRGHRRHECVGPGRRHHRHLPHQRHDHGCGQLHVRQRPGHDVGGCGPVCGTVPCGAGPVRAVLPQALRRDVR